MHPLTVAKKRSRIFFGWHMVGASFVTNLMVAATYWHGFQVFFLPILNHFGWSRAALSGAFALRQLEGGFIAPILGFTVDRIGPRRVIVAGGVIMGMGMIALSLTSSLWTFYLYFLVTAIGATGLSHSITWPVIVSRWFKRRRGRALGIATSGPVLSGIPMLLTTWLVVELGWRTVMALSGLAMWLVVVPVGLAVRNAPEPYGLLPDEDSADEDLPQPGTALVKTVAEADQGGYTVGQALRDKVFWITMSFFGFLFLGVSGFSVHQIPYFESLGLSSSEATFTVAIVFLVSAVGRMGSGWLSDLIDIRIVLAAVVIINLAGWLYLLVVDANSVVRALPFTVLLGISLGATFSLRPVLLVRLYGTRALGSLGGLLHAGPIVTGMIGPWVMGRIFDVTAEYTQSLYVLAVATALALPLALLVRSRSVP